MRRALALCLLLGTAQAQYFLDGDMVFPLGTLDFGQLDWMMPISGSTPALYLPLNTPGCYASGSALGSRGEAVTVTRATTATYTDCAGATQTCNNNELRVGCESGVVRGALIERAATNYVLNNRTHPKAAEATGSFPTAACVGWHEGTGTMTIANGTATTTGLSCTAVSPGTLCTFTVTVGGTMAITTSAGTVTKAQIECPGSTKTSEIPTAGTAVARNADVATVPTPALSTTGWSIESTPTPYGGRSWTGSGSNVIWGFGTYNGLNSAHTQASSTAKLSFVVYDGSAVRLTEWTHGYASTGAHRICSMNNAGNLNMRSDGALVLQTQSGAGTGISNIGATLYLGQGSSGSQFDGYVASLKVFRDARCGR